MISPGVPLRRRVLFWSFLHVRMASFFGESVVTAAPLAVAAERAAAQVLDEAAGQSVDWLKLPSGFWDLALSRSLTDLLDELRRTDPRLYVHVKTHVRQFVRIPRPTTVNRFEEFPVEC